MNLLPQHNISHSLWCDLECYCISEIDNALCKTDFLHAKDGLPLQLRLIPHFKSVSTTNSTLLSVKLLLPFLNRYRTPELQQFKHVWNQDRGSRVRCPLLSFLILPLRFAWLSDSTTDFLQVQEFLDLQPRYY